MNTNGFRERLVSLITVFYTIVMPMVIVVLLLGVSQFITRPKLLGSEIADLVIRILLCLWFCFGYRRLPHLSNYRVFPSIQWSKSDIGTVEKLYYLFLASFFGFSVTMVSWWTILVFIPIFGNFSFVLALFNGVICALPVAVQYEVLKL